MALSLAAASRSWDVMEPVTLESGWDLSLSKDRALALDYVARERPDVIVAARPGTAFSAMQNLMKNHSGYQEKLDLKIKEALPLVEFSARLAEIQVAGGRHFLGENPLTSKAWQTKPGQRMLRMLFPTKTHFCAHGLKDPEWGMPIKKSTMLVTTSENVSRSLGLQCPGGHDHRQIKSTWRDLSGRRVNASEWCGGYSAEFATNILVAFEKQLKTEILDCFTIAGLGNDVAARARRAALDDVPLSIRKTWRTSAKGSCWMSFP